MWGCADVTPQGEQHCLGQVSVSVNSLCAQGKNNFLFAKEELGKTQFLLFYSCIIPTKLIADNHCKK